MEYIIKWKDEDIALAEIDNQGNMLRVSNKIINPELAPLAYRKEPDWLKRWWKERCLPLSQGRVKDMLAEKGLAGPSEFLVNNLGLSLTDYYWVKPLGSSYKWKDVSLFENDFKENLLIQMEDSSQKRSFSLSPNSSLQGDLEKSWQIRNAARVLIKGNYDKYSSESINEVLASELHRRQKCGNFTEYSLIRIKGKEYRYGCICNAFTDSRMEFIPAWDIITSEKKPNNLSTYEFFIRLCVQNGLNEELLRRDLEYQIEADYVLANRDRHMNNIGVLRDSETLKFVRLAPIFDSGKCLWVGKEVPDRWEDIVNGKVNSFAGEDLKMLQFITNRHLLKTDALLSEKDIRTWYAKDPQIAEARVDRICKAYSVRIKYFEEWQNGGK